MGIVEITGTEGTLIVPDPNRFTGEVKITRAPALPARSTRGSEGRVRRWESVPITGVYAERGLGVLDLARAARTGGRPLASGELGFHVLDTLVAIDEAVAEDGASSRSRAGSTAVPLVAEDFDPFARTL